ncbi:MAG TPA: preprotein translocase subunit YajC [Methylophilaceae bacterium]|jgi:preprotein translocase subunit YajC
MLISSAYAASGAATQDWMSLAPMVVIFVLFYFMLIRPQMKQAKETKAMIEALQKGDEVVTTGGIVGRVAKVSNDFVVLEITDSVSINVQKQAVQTLLPKGTIKAI